MWDDTFLLFDNEEQANQFLDYMNNRHPRIKFTIETEENNKLPFLDLLISKHNNTFDLSIYRKPIFTNLGVNFISACYENFKMNTFNTLFFRAYKLSSTYEAFHKEICFLNNFFKMNGYTDNLFFRKLRNFLNNIFKPPVRENGPRKLNLYFKIPYFRDNTNKYFKEEITKVLNKYFPQIKAIPVFYNNFKIQELYNP